MRISALTFCTLLATTALASQAFAQEASIVPYPVRQFADENGVDLLTGTFTAYSPSIHIGGELGLRYEREIRADKFRDTMMGTIFVSGSTYTVGLGGAAETFTLSGSVFVPTEQNGSTLTKSGSTYTYTNRDGVVAILDGTTYNFGNAQLGTITSLTYPSGRKLSFYYTTASFSTGSWHGRRLQSVTSNTGYHLKFRYASDTVTGSSDEPAWSRIVGVKGLNTSVDTCSVTAFSCPQTGRPELAISVNTLNGQQTYTDAEGRSTIYTVTAIGGGFGKAVTAIRMPGSTAINIDPDYTNGKVSSVTRFGVTTTYAYADASGVRTVTVTLPGSATRVLTFDIAKSLLLSDTNELNATTSYTYDSNNRLTRVTMPEANYVEQSYDARGNVTQKKAVAKPGTGLPDVVTSSVFPTVCATAITCNMPTSATDARGNTTDFTYDSTHGGVVTTTAPAAASGANRSETRVTYTRLDSGGAASATGTYVPTAISTCRSGNSATCVGTSDEVKTITTYGYGLQPSSISQGAGDGSLTAISSMTYDAVGNLLTVDGPLSGTADTTRYRWNLNRERIGIIGPDPDGGGSRKHLASRMSFNPRGQVWLNEIGTVDSQSDADWINFAKAYHLYSQIDANGRTIRQTVWSNNVDYSVADYLYDSRGRQSCAITYMDPTQWGPQAATCAALQTNGSNGPDRVVRTNYDAANQVTSTESAIGTSAAATVATFTYSLNGMRTSLKDGENNLTTFEYDGHDRLKKTRFPVPTKGSNASSTIDYEELTYEDWSSQTRTSETVSSKRLRDGNLITFAYDALDRVTTKDLPGTEGDVTYNYDLLGRTTGVSQNGYNLTFAYDALSRQTYDGQGWGYIARTFDLAGNLTRTTWWDGFYVDYDRDVTGRLLKVRENGATSGLGVLADFAYDNLGRRISVTRGNGTSASYNYNAISRLTSLSQDLAGSSNDFTIGSIGYDPAGGMVTQTRSNDSYAWSGHGNGSTSSTADGLNRLSAHAGGTPSYDGRQNLIYEPASGKSYSFTAENRLASASGGTTIYYDPIGRLSEYETTVSTRFMSDGPHIAVEVDNPNSNVLRRYVRGDGPDELLVWYEGSGTTNRRFAHADERGSIVAYSDNSGGLVGINKYDEYGVPFSGNIGRMQYTGQAWLPEAGVYHYKARAYAPHLGRFLQPDPSGYDAGANLYAYVENDPVNGVDPGGDRRITLGEARLLRGMFGAAFAGWAQDHLQIVPMPWVLQASGFRDHAAIGLMRLTQGQGGSYRDDFSKLTAPERITFWHEFFHYFQRYNGLSSFTQQLLNQARSGGQDRSLYTYNPKIPFSQNNPEAQAKYFAECVAGGGPCGDMNFTLRPDSFTTITVRGSTMVITVSAPGTRIVTVTTIQLKDH